ncbi:MAG: polysaccharide export protein [Cellvibrionales bacterium]|nr:polysaccharide export protein [Cellvibrionales bacterium]
MRILSALFILVLSAVTLTKTYVLDTGDTIDIQVTNESELSMRVTLDASGTIAYPFLGKLALKGKTMDEIKATIDKGLRGDYLINPNIQVSIVAYRAFFIHGEVNQPKDYPFRPGLTIQQAISIAGGYTERAHKHKFNLTRAGETISAELDTQMQPGDILRIPRSIF